MELLLIVALGVALFVVWNISRRDIDRTREAVDLLEREVDFLRGQLEVVARAARKPEETKPADVAPEGGKISGSRAGIAVLSGYARRAASGRGLCSPDCFGFDRAGPGSGDQPTDSSAATGHSDISTAGADSNHSACPVSSRATHSAKAFGTAAHHPPRRAIGAANAGAPTRAAC